MKNYNLIYIIEEYLNKMMFIRSTQGQMESLKDSSDDTKEDSEEEDNPSMYDIVKENLRKDRLFQLISRAKNGDVLSQIILGDIYFYGIDTNNTYWNDLDNMIALSKYSRRKDKRNYGVICSCKNNPDYEEALKWYTMAADLGSEAAQQKVNQIRNGHKINKKSTYIQMIGIK